MFSIIHLPHFLSAHTSWLGGLLVDHPLHLDTLLAAAIGFALIVTLWRMFRNPRNIGSGMNASIPGLPVRGWRMRMACALNTDSGQHLGPSWPVQRKAWVSHLQ